MSTAANSPRTERRTQQRSLETRAALLDAATRAFATRGFDGISVRQLEEQAGVKRGLVAYHFGDKDGLWRAVVDRLFAGMAARFGDRLDVYADLPPREAARAVVRAFVRYSAEHPELNRLMLQECGEASWRVDYLVGEHVRPLLDGLEASVPEAYGLLYGTGRGEDAAHRYYLFVGAAAFVFSAEHECRGLFHTAPRREAFVDRHADLVTDMLIPREGEKE
ncbi:MAG: TetR family transcriptional regulator [Pseudomonadales bacterium]|nr:TetR family transcriptional regulator [Pseudomonadales bacterium]